MEDIELLAEITSDEDTIKYYIQASEEDLLNKKYKEAIEGFHKILKIEKWKNKFGAILYSGIIKAYLEQENI